MNPRSIRFRLTAWYAGLLATALLLFGAIVYYRLQRHLEGQLNASLVEQARTIGEELLVSVSTRGEPFVIAEINESYSPEISGRFVRVTRPDGSVLYQSKSPRDSSFVASEIPPVSGELRAGYPPRVVDVAGRDVVLQGVSCAVKAGRFLVETGAAYQPIAVELRTLRVAFALGIPVFLTGGVLVGLVLVRKSLHPIRAITEQAERISSQNLNERLPVVRTGDEVERLALSLNRMMERLETAVQHASRFSGDVSHELRTPLTILRGELEAMANEQHRHSDSVEQIGSALEEIERLSTIVEQLLVISRLDAGQAGMERVRVDLGLLATRTAEEMGLLAEEQDVALRSSIERGVIVEGDPLRLKQVIVNLLDNAIKYTPEGGVIEVAVRAAEGMARLEVSDNGIGIKAEAVPHVFERFYRADKARSRASGGAGLGLSIVKSIAAAHEGQLSVRSSEGVGTVVRLDLPLVSGERAQPAGKLEEAWGSVVRHLS
jgi:heavy metal sensor kinase